MAGDRSSATEAKLKFAELLLKKGMQEEARGQLQELLREEPACARGHYVLGVVLTSEGAPQEAVPHFQEALRLVPDDFKALNALGVALQQLGGVDEALARYREAVRLRPHFQDARINLALLLKDQGKLCAAEREIASALQIDPESIRLRYNLANLLHLQGKSVEAVQAYRETLRIDPDHLDARQNLLFSLHYSPQFSDRQIYAEHLRAARRKAFRPPTDLASRIRPPGLHGRRIRIGYVSADFRDHAVSRFIEPILAHHDRSRFEVFCYANLSRPDLTTQRLQKLADHWRDIYGITDEKAAFIIESDGIEILVDLSGHTAGNRLPLFARRPAPLQVTWIGYPDTTGLRQMDYRVSDRLSDPPGRERFHTERLIWLKRTFSCYQPPPEAPAVGPLPFDGSGRITFGSFNNLAKVPPEVIALWGRVLLGVKESRLLMKAKPLSDPEVRTRIFDGFSRAGIASERIELRGGEPTTEAHLAQYHDVDIALDTFPYNGTTTTCEALWMGVPVVTLAGTRHAARTGVSLLSNCGLEALVAETPDQFVSIATELAADTYTLGILREVLRERMQQSPLMDAAGVTREVEDAFVEILRLPR